VARRRRARPGGPLRLLAGSPAGTEGDDARGTGWLARARRLVDELDRDCAERGLLLTQHFAVKSDTFTLAGAVLAGEDVDTTFL
jgi:hypothetical protein